MTLKTTLVLAPHGDDETLFVAYTCMRTKAHVIVCTHDADPGVRTRRRFESMSATRLMGCTNQEWPMSAASPDWGQAKRWLEQWGSEPLVQSTPARVYAPVIHEDGHEQHNAVGQLALDVFGEGLVTGYFTYAPRGQRSREGAEVVPTAAEIACKLGALACYQSQIENPATRPWFFDLLDLREWLTCPAN